jgi:hypothetical protein
MYFVRSIFIKEIVIAEFVVADPAERRAAGRTRVPARTYLLERSPQVELTVPTLRRTTFLFLILSHLDHHTMGVLDIVPVRAHFTTCGIVSDLR